MSAKRKSNKRRVIRCQICRHRIDTVNTEYIENPETHEYYCLSCAGAALDELLSKYPTAIAD